MRAKKLIATAVAAATLGVGGLAVAAVNPLSGASAQVDPTPDAGPETETGAPAETEAPDDEATADADGKGKAKGEGEDEGNGRAEGKGRRGRGAAKALDEVLADLVTKGTITQAQADAVKAALLEKVGEQGKNRGNHLGHRKQAVANAAEAIGISAEDLVAALKNGQSIAEVAQANAVEPQAVIDALVAAATTRIDEAVADGTLEADRATKLKDRLPEAFDKFVNRKRAPR